MFRNLKMALLVGALAACTVSPVFAGGAEGDKGDKGGKGGEKIGPPVGATPPGVVPPGAHDPCGPSMVTIPVVECVPETYKVKQVVYKKVCKQETYTSFRCESFPVTKTRQVTTYVRKAVYKDVCKTVYDRVPCVEERCVMKPCYRTVQVTEMRTKRVDKGHWVCEEVPAHFKNFCSRLGSLCSRKNDCCDPCADPCAAPSCPPSHTRTVKRWQSCWVTECCPVTVCKKVCEMKPEICKVTTYKCVPRQVTCKVCTYVCEPCVRTETYCCYETRQVPVTCTRNVWSCVPCEEWVTCTRLVAKTTYRQVPACNTNCGETTNFCCTSSSSRGHGLFRGLFNRNSCGGGHGHGHNGGSNGGCCH